MCGDPRRDSVVSVSVLLFGRGGTYRLSWSLHRKTAAPWPARRTSDEASAVALARDLTTGVGALTRVRALLADDLGGMHRIDDGEVVHHLARRLARGHLLVERVPDFPLHGWDRETPESEPPPARAEKMATPDPRTWIEIELLDEEGQPVPYERYWISLPDGAVREGMLDGNGRAHFGDLDPGQCEVRFPRLDDEAVARPGEALRFKSRVLAPPPPAKPVVTWVEIALIGMDGRPIPSEKYRIALPGGELREGVLDERGCARVDGIDPGTCQISFPALDEEAWEPA